MLHRISSTLALIVIGSGTTYAQGASASFAYWRGFQSPVQYALGANGWTINTVDLNGDGVLDFAINSAPNIIVVLSDGPNSYAPAAIYPAPGTANGRAVLGGDFDRDGDQDLAYLIASGTPGSGNFTINILSNAGDGTLIPGGAFEVIHPAVPGMFFQSNQWTSTDLNGDGAPDIAIAATVGGLVPGDGYLTVVLNTTSIGGAMSFAEGVHMDTGFGTPLNIQHADLDNDGDEDIAMTHSRNNGVSVFLNDGSGTAGTIDKMTLSGSNGFGNRPLGVGDMNSDGYADLVYSDPRTNTLKLVLNLDGGTDPNKAGQFRQDVDIQIGSASTTEQISATMVADFDGDGFSGVASSFSGDTGHIQLLRTGGPALTLASGVRQIAVAVDLEGDGDVDFASVNGPAGTLTIVRNRGNRVLRSAKRR